MDLKNLNKIVKMSRQDERYKSILQRSIKTKIQYNPSKERAMRLYANRINITI